MNILYSDEILIAIDKPPGLTVHDAPGPGSSVLRELREKHKLADLTPIHRIDKDASGVLLLARSAKSAAEWQKVWPKVQKVYLALCEGIPKRDCGVIDAPILENQTDKPERIQRALAYFKKTQPEKEIPGLPPPKTSAVHPAGRESQTEYRVIEKFELKNSAWSWLEIRPQQGRMHQIRVHLAHLGHPLACDPLYGKRRDLNQSDVEGAGARVLLVRMPLHASALSVPRPAPRIGNIAISAPLPEDLKDVLEYLRARRLRVGLG
jgi:23S rRNA-/tRNA-specific pseudouridylate synthase